MGLPAPPTSPCHGNDALVVNSQRQRQSRRPCQLGKEATTAAYCISGLGAAWALHHHADRFDFRLLEAQGRIGGDAVTADVPQDDGTSIPFDISVTACIPALYHHIVLLMKQFGIELVDDFLSLHASDPQFMPESNFRFAFSAALIAGVYLGDMFSFAVYAMASQPELYSKIQSEADAMFADGDSTVEDVHASQDRRHAPLPDGVPTHVPHRPRCPFVTS